MAMKGRRPRLKGNNIQASIKIKPESLKRFLDDLKRLEFVARKEIVDTALLAGGEVIRAEAESRAPGPHIVKELEDGKTVKKWKSSSQAGTYKGIVDSSRCVVIGPDSAHWFYRFQEFGTKTHGVTKRKRTKTVLDLRKSGMTTKDIRKSNAGALGRKPVMAWMQAGKLIIARTVRGMAAKPFLRPAADSKGEAANQAMARVLASEIKKALR